MQIYDCLISKEQIKSFFACNGELFFFTTTSFIKIEPKKSCKASFSIKNEELFTKTKKIIFDNDCRYIALIYECKILIYDAVLKIIINKLEIEDISNLCFDDKSRTFFIAVKNSRIYQYTLRSDNILSRVVSFDKKENIKALKSYENLVAAGSFDGKLIVSDFFSKKNILKLYMDLSIYSICFLDKTHLVLGHIDGSVSFVDIATKSFKNIKTPFIKPIKTFVACKGVVFVVSNENFVISIDIKKQKIIDMKYLSFDADIKDMHLYNEDLLVFFLSGDKIVFADIELKTRHKQKPQKELFRYMESFEALFREKKYPQAFAVASNHKELKLTKTYMELQKVFISYLKLAAKYIKAKDKQKAKEVISKFASVNEKKEIVKFLLNYGEDFLEFIYLINKNDFKSVYELLKKYPEFKDSYLFKEMKKYIYTLFNEMERKIDNLDFEINVLLLEEMEPYDKRAENLKEKYIKSKELYKLYKNDEFLKCFEMIFENECLKQNIIASMLEKHWQKLIIRADELAVEGNLKELIKLFQELIKLKSKREKISELLKISSRVGIKKLLKKSQYNLLEKAIYDYVELFGKDLEIDKIIKIYESKSLRKLVFKEELLKKEDRWVLML